LPDTGTDSGGNDPESVFDKSLGDFDGAIARERGTIGASGRGSAQGAGDRERDDAEAVKTAGDGPELGKDGDPNGRPSAQTGGPGQAGDLPDTPPPGADSGGAPEAGGEDAGATAETGAGRSTDKGSREGSGTGDLPEDIPADGTGEDQVARQLREAAMAEQDPVVREALWEQYRRHTGLKRKS
jgi:hypothetical protein